MRLSVMLALLILLPAFAFGQQTTGNLQGRVLDEQGDPIAYVNVTLRGPSLLGTRGTISASDGLFRVLSVPVGKYSVDVQHVGFRDMSIEGVHVPLGGTISVGELRLQVEAVQMETMVVTAAELMDPLSTEFGENLTEEEMKKLPIQRDYREVISYLPQVQGTPLEPAVRLPAGGISIGGSSGTENSYMIDGVNVTDNFFADSGIQLPPNFIREIELKAGGYEAEFGRSSGGIVNVVTKSGTDEFQGDTFAFFTGDEFSKNQLESATDTRQRGFQKFDAGVSVGGPWIRDKLRYFLAYNPSVSTKDLQLLTNTIHEDKITSHRFAGKLDWRANSTTDLSLSVLGDPTKWDRVGLSTVAPLTPVIVGNPDPYLGDWTTGGIAVALRARKLLGQRGILEANASWFDSQRKAEPATERGATEIGLTDYATGERSGGYEYTFDHHSIRQSASVASTFFLGSHELKAGLEYEENTLDDQWHFQTRNGAPGLLTTFGNGIYFANLLDLDQDLTHRVPSVYLQNSWRLTERLRLNAGIRWDGLYIINSDGTQVGSIEDQYQPRFGFAYEAGSEKQHKFSGSAGRFYEQMPIVGSFTLGKFRQSIWQLSCDPRFCAPDTLASFEIGPDGSTRLGSDIKGPHFDELVLGYERMLGEGWGMGVRGIRRELQEAFDDLGNPGRGDLSAVPRPKREYSALEFTASKTRGKRWTVAASYVLSKLYGNYSGPGGGVFFPHRSTNFDYAQQYVNAEGLLGVDRTHVFKAYGSYEFDLGLTVGGYFTWQSGKPISETGIMMIEPPFPTTVFMSEQGSYGRTPSIWDLNLRFAYDLASVGSWNRVQPRLLVDIFHLFSEREVTDVVGTRYSVVDPDTREGLVETANFGQPTAFQPPMMVRVGIEAGF